MKEHYDVIVGGGGAAGVASAIGASRTGARTLLIERGPCLGGAATMRNVLTYCGIYTNEEPPRQVVYGVAQEVLAALRAEGAVSGPQRFTAPAVVFDPKRSSGCSTSCAPRRVWRSGWIARSSRHTATTGGSPHSKLPTMPVCTS